MKRWARQAPQHGGEFLNRITERLDSPVKGLTPVFPALLLTIKLAFRRFAEVSRCLAAGRNIRRQRAI
jgi:hypothetical protein